MRQCKSCNTLFDNGVRFCERCGSDFPYDPKITPYSEGKIAITLIILIAIALIAFNKYVSMPITNQECSRTNYLRVQKLIDESRNRVMRVQDHGYIPISGGTIIMSERYARDKIYLPPCFVPIRQDMIEYYLLMHGITQMSAYGGQAYTLSLLEKAVAAQNRVDQKFEEINQCLPNCPLPSSDDFQTKH